LRKSFSFRECITQRMRKNTARQECHSEMIEVTPLKKSSLGG